MTVTIERVEVLCLQDPQAAYYRFEGSYQNVVVLVQGDNGLVGIGESDAPPEIVKAVIEMLPYNHLAEGLADIVTRQAVDDPPASGTRCTSAPTGTAAAAPRCTQSARLISQSGTSSPGRWASRSPKLWAVVVTTVSPPTRPSIP